MSAEVLHVEHAAGFLSTLIRDLLLNLTMQSIECIIQVDRGRLAILSAWLDREVPGAHGGLTHIVDAVQEMSLVILRLRYAGRVSQHSGEYLAHDILEMLT